MVIGVTGVMWALQAGGELDWALPQSHVMQIEGDRELYVGGVHVHIFLKEPNFPLRNPKVHTCNVLDAMASIDALPCLMPLLPHCLDSCNALVDAIS